MKAVWRSDVGRLRESNQDSLLVLEGEYPLYAVADGMGGHRGGDTASAMAVAGLRSHLEGQKLSAERLRRSVEQISREIYNRQLSDEQLSGMGTTLTILWEGRERVLLGHVGDSRAYLLRAGSLRQLTQDHSLVGELLRSGTLDALSARSYPYRNIITRAVGTQAKVRCDTLEEDRLAGDRWLICSDGLTEHVEDREIASCLQMASLDEAADALLKSALEAGGRDNITLMLLEVPA